MISRSHRVTEMHENEMGTLIVEGKVTVELKSVEKVHPAHKKQFLTYLRLTGMKLRRRPDEGWHHANRLRRVMSPSPWLCGSVRTKQSEQGGAPERAIRAFSDGKVTCARLVTAVVIWDAALTTACDVGTSNDCTIVRNCRKIS